jgi:hypothetical protein
VDNRLFLEVFCVHAHEQGLTHLGEHIRLLRLLLAVFLVQIEGGEHEDGDHE